MLDNLIKTALGEMKADLIIKGTDIVNTITKEVYPADIGISHNQIVRVGKVEDLIGNDTIVVETQGVSAPGFFDSHIHIESSMLTPSNFSKYSLLHGTTSIVWDPHEIVNAAGIAGIKEFLLEARNVLQRIYFLVPTCVPAAPELETTKHSISEQDIATLLSLYPRSPIIGLGEMMNYPGVLHADPTVLAKLETGKDARVIDGHAPSLTGKELNAYLSAGIMSDHETTQGDEALEKLRLGMWLQIREGTGCKNLENILKAIIDKKIDTMHCLLATDDLSASDLITKGHIDYVIKRAVESGIDPITAIQMATVNPATYLGLDKAFGSITPGKTADIVILDDLDSITPSTVIFNGKLVAKDGQLLVSAPKFAFSESIKKTIEIQNPPKPSQFFIKTKKRKPQSVRAIGVKDGTIYTTSEEGTVSVKKGKLEPNLEEDILAVAVIERYTNEGNIGKGFVKGFGIQSGAIASSFAHDSHNIVVVGANQNDMGTAVNHIIELNGGLVVVKDGEILADLPLPIGGILSDASGMTVAKNYVDLLKIAKTELNCSLKSPFFTISFIALPVIPELKITDKGLIDVSQQKIVDIFVK
ncbi:MAG: adenine deaminase [Candidatus Lokiarchaeota archaeon]|nr:adenine deaminase [Candidatus Lokiarchaeota archaeon]